MDEKKTIEISKDHYLELIAVVEAATNLVKHVNYSIGLSGLSTTSYLASLLNDKLKAVNVQVTDDR